MDYSHFLFYCLIKDTDNNHPLKTMEYDLAYKSISKFYDEFFNSTYNSVDRPEYDCIVDYLLNETIN